MWSFVALVIAGFELVRVRVFSIWRMDELVLVKPPCLVLTATMCYCAYYALSERTLGDEDSLVILCGPFWCSKLPLEALFLPFWSFGWRVDEGFVWC